MSPRITRPITDPLFARLDRALVRDLRAGHEARLDAVDRRLDALEGFDAREELERLSRRLDALTEALEHQGATTGEALDRHARSLERFEETDALRAEVFDAAVDDLTRRIDALARELQLAVAALNALRDGADAVQPSER